MNLKPPKILRVPQADVDRLKREVAIERLCTLYGIELKPRGKDLAACCPFHDDKDPSFIVSPSKNLWNCLGGCGGGDNIALVMRREKVSFRRACEKLKEILGEVYVAPKITLNRGRGKEHSVLVDHKVSDQELFDHVVEYYHRSFMNDPKAMQYLQMRKCFHPEAVNQFKLGYSNRTLSYRIPYRLNQVGATLREQLERIGIYRESGREHLIGSLVIPIFNRHEKAVQLYGRKILRQTTGGQDHLYLAKPLCGVWNWQSLVHQKEWLLCEAPLDALTMWCHGFRNVTCSYGTNNFTADHWALLEELRPERIIICYDNDRAGNEATAKLSEQLAIKNFTVLRAKPPPDRDVNDLACESREPHTALAAMLEKAEVLFTRRADETPLIKEAALSPLVADLAAKEENSDVVETASPEIEASSPIESETATKNKEGKETESDFESDTHTLRFGQRVWRVRGIGKNLSYEILKVQLRMSFGEPDRCQFFTDTLDLYNAKHRQNFVLQAQAETQVAADVLKRDIGQVLLAGERLQEKIIRQTLEPQEKKTVSVTSDEREEALKLLRDPKLLDRILQDYERCGVVGETTNKLLGYLAAISRKMDDPLAVIIQSTSAAGKSSLMEAVLSFVPEEERVQYSAMTGQSLYYLGDSDLKHKILAVVEEEGAEKASYALKLLQSEGELTIASTGKDPNTGRMVTQEYRVEGPVMILLTTTAIEIDEELLNRCIVLTVDESREQTKRIHELQREAETLEGLVRKIEKKKILACHRNAQRLLRPLRVVNPYAKKLTFLDDRTRTRRDHMKYLALIRVIALLHQYQREIKVANGTQYIEVALDDIAIANRLAGDVLGRSVDELAPQTRRFLELLTRMTREHCEAQHVQRSEHRFTQRAAREFTGWSDFQVKTHLRKLAELEYVLVHRSMRGQSFTYELLYDGEGKDGKPFLMGLLDVATLCTSAASHNYDTKREHEKPRWEHQNGERELSGSIEGVAKEHGGSNGKNGHFTSENGNGVHENGENAQAEEIFASASHSRNGI